MKYRFFILVFLFFTLGLPVGAESIVSYNTTYTIEPQGRVNTTETIRYDFEDLKKHGLLRTIPLTKTNNEGKQFAIGFNTLRIYNEADIQYPFTASEIQGVQRLKIGDPNAFVTGEHVYILSYTLSGALTYFSDHDEFFWNTVGTEWQIPIENASATVYLPQTIPYNAIVPICFVGTKGSTDQTHCTIQKEAHSIVFRSTVPLAPAEGMTIGVRFPKGYIDVLEPVPVQSLFDNHVVVLILYLSMFLWYILLPLLILVRWWNNGRDPKPTIGQAHVGFDIPKHESGIVLTPAEFSFLLEETLTPHGLTATVVDLAHKGYILFTQQDKNWILTKHTEQKTPLTPHEKILLNALFSHNTTVEVKDITLFPEYISIKKLISASSVEHGWFIKNPELQRQLYQLLIVLGIGTGNLFLLFVSAVFGIRMPKRTQKGANLTAVAKALKTFLVSQGKQYEFQAKDIYLFEKLLPYAVSLGIEKIWAKRFAHLTVPPPDWYKGTDTFSTVLFATTLKTQLQTINATMTSTSSSSGFSSGFSSGSSGGGGGGGGGGSW